MDERLPKIDEVISTVFGEALGLSTGVKRRRTLQVENDLRAFLETEAERYLTDDERTLLAAEQEFEPSGAACRSLEAEVLFVALTGFITPPHLAPDLLLRRVQLDLIDALAGYVAYEVLRNYDSSSIRRDLRSAIYTARHELKRERREQSWAREVARMTPVQREAIEYAERQIDKLIASRHTSAEGLPATPAAYQARDPQTE
ncbi:hypothetical protein E3O42_04905 [Cryobacterium adonitolivorans]|uniref:Uncharacterized protein n=1 Tax=Cryobacterium adonitolivorans TaxID=1259189 RepID=A0A4R8WAB3_9MICO|nr:hypothetical protein [Cryobacterium adonitolivorans]TFC04837.1 hypothetical protein E3O42_04905 [Cryobacterium adonitolivorans]